MACADNIVDRCVVPPSLRPRTHSNVSPSSPCSHHSFPLYPPSFSAIQIPRPSVNNRLTGFVWSLPVAFLLVVTGSILGESLLFLSFRHFLHDRIVLFRKEHEENYGTMVQVINQHKRWMVFLIRLSAIPVWTHYLTYLIPCSLRNTCLYCYMVFFSSTRLLCVLLSGYLL